MIIALSVIGSTYAVVHATDLVITDPAYVEGTVTLGSDPVTSGTVSLQTAGFAFTGNIDSSGAYGPVVVQSTAEDGTLLSYGTTLNARFQSGTDFLSNTYLRIRRNEAGLQVGGNLTETHDFTYDATQVKRIALTLRMASGSPGTLSRVTVFTNEVSENGERYSSYISCCTSLGGVTEKTFILPVIGSGEVTVRGTVYLLTDSGTEISRSLDAIVVDLGTAGPYAVEWPAFDLSDLTDTGSLEVSMDLAHATPPAVTHQYIYMSGVGGTPTQGFSRYFYSPNPGLGPFTVADLVAGEYYGTAYTLFAGGGFLAHPYPAQNNRFTITAGGTTSYDADVELLKVTGNIPMEGMLTPSSVSSRSIQAEPDNAATSPTRGGWSSIALDKDTGDFSLWLTPGPWRVRYHSVSASEPETPDTARLSASLDTYHNFYGDAFQDFQADTGIGFPVDDRGLAPITETSLFFDIKEPFGQPGVDLRCPSLYGYSSQPSKYININASGSCNNQPVHELRFIGEPGSYTVNAYVYQASNNSRIQFVNVPLFLNEPLVVNDAEPVVLQEYAPASPGSPERHKVEVIPQGVSTPGYMTVLQSPIGPDEPEGSRILGGTEPNYYNITTGNDLSLTGARVCIGFSDLGGDAAEQLLEMQHFVDGAWEVLSNRSVDSDNNVVCADTTSFSPFVLTLPLPSANAGTDQTVCVSSEAEIAQVSLNGSGSTDPLGGALAYTWSQGGAEIATGVAPTVDLGLGAHTLSLVVSSGDIESLPDDVSVTVEVCQSSCNADGGLWAACTPECPCYHGGGDCDSDDECADGLRCLHDAGLLYGYDDPEVDVCVAGCPSEGAGAWNFCTPECPCDDGGGDCDSDDECAPGLRCLHDAGLLYGYDDAEVDVCVAGCPSEGAGAWNFCTPECPCAAGQGDCDGDDECAAGLHCVRNVGANYGFDAGVDVCE